MAIEQKTKDNVRSKASKVGVAVHRGVAMGAVHIKDTAQVVLLSVFELGKGLVTGSPRKKNS